MTEVLTEVEIKKVTPIIEYLEENTKITPKAAARLTGKSVSTTYRYLKILTDHNVVEQIGSTNNKIYVLRGDYNSQVSEKNT